MTQQHPTRGTLLASSGSGEAGAPAVDEAEVVGADHPGMARVPGGTFAMGSADFYPEEAPVHRVGVDPFWIDRHPVTVSEFRRCVADTGHVTLAERPLDPADYPEADPAVLVPG